MGGAYAALTVHLGHSIRLKVRFVDHEREIFFRCIDCHEDLSAGVRE